MMASSAFFTKESPSRIEQFRSGSPRSEDVDPDDVDALLAEELNEMTFHERENVYEEIHGVDQEVEETEELLERSLLDLEAALQHVPYRHIYDVAWQESRAYVENRSFRLMFLRAEYYDAEKAAVRLVKFLKGKARFFGPETLTRPIYLSDLNANDMAFMKSGILQVVQSRDRSGRAILSDFNMDPNFEIPDIHSLIKTIIYIFCSLAEDEETQRRGVVGIFYFTAALKVVQQLHESDADLFSWIPLKIVGGHFCFNDPRIRMVKALLMLVIGRERRVRVRLHEGSHTECQYKLMMFGVPVHVFPVTYEGELKTTNHLKWLSRRLAREEEIRRTGNFCGVDLPAAKDVLLGRGKTVQDHHGNVLMRNRVAGYMSEYKKAAKLEKGQVALKVVLDTRKSGGRFLKRGNNGWWVEVSDETAREKISMTFRTTISTFVPPKEKKTQIAHYKRDEKKARMSDDENVIDNGPCFGFNPFR